MEEQSTGKGDEEQRFIDDALAEKEDLEEEERNEEIKRLKYKFQTDQLCLEDTKSDLVQFTNVKVIKMSRIFQSVFYMLRYNREDICQVLTNKIFWKRAKNLFNNKFFDKIQEYTPFGQK